MGTRCRCLSCSKTTPWLGSLGSKLPQPSLLPLPQPARHPLAALGMDFLPHKSLTLLLFLEPCMHSFSLQIGTWKPVSRFHLLWSWSYEKVPILAPLPPQAPSTMGKTRLLPLQLLSLLLHTHQLHSWVRGRGILLCPGLQFSTLFLSLTWPQLPPPLLWWPSPPHTVFDPHLHCSGHSKSAQSFPH